MSNKITTQKQHGDMDSGSGSGLDSGLNNGLDNGLDTGLAAAG